MSIVRVQKIYKIHHYLKDVRSKISEEVSSMKPYIVIHAFNPDSKLYSLVKELNEHNLMVVVVNDGSTKYPID